MQKKLTFAAAAGSARGVAKWLAAGADPIDSQALLAAVRNGHLEVVKLLLPVSDPKVNDSIALRAAVSYGNPVIVALLLPASDPKAVNSESIRRAAAHGRVDIVKLLLPLCDPGAVNSKALRWAAAGGHADVVRVLLPLCDPAPLLLDNIFMLSRAGDMLLSVMPGATAQTYMDAHPDVDFPRTRALISAKALADRGPPGQCNKHVNKRSRV